MRKTIRAYTVLELTVVMALSAICIGLVYTSYRIIVSSYREFDAKQSRISDLVFADRVIRSDIRKARLMQKTDEGILLTIDTTQVDYQFGKGFILRQVLPDLTDTIRIAAVMQYDPYTDVVDGDILGKLRLSFALDSQSLDFVYSKSYSSADLLSRDQPLVPNPL